jgi:predicted DNA-binding transcriptional regulator YafY
MAKQHSQGERILLMLTEPRLWRSGLAPRELAAELGVTVRQLRRDRDLLERFGFPTRVDADDDGVHRLRFRRDRMPTPCPELGVALARRRGEPPDGGSSDVLS